MGGSKAAGPGGSCKCPKCGKSVKHQGIPCYQQNCPKCGTKMVRK
jgi:Zn finger protein HypA/HybF involved in hydrogenase expression